MNDHKEHISQYSAADIQAYVQGKLSAADMHAMEKAALDDPFLADAMEGMQQAFDEHKESLVTGQLQQLHQEFQTRTAGKAKVIAFKPFRYWQAAAAAVIILIIGVWMFSLVNKSKVAQNSVPVIAKTEKQEPQQQTPTPALADGKEISINTDSVIPPETTPNKSNSYRKKQEVAANAAPPASSEERVSGITNNYTQDSQAETNMRVTDNPATYFAKPEKKEDLDAKNMGAMPSAAAAPIVVKSFKNDAEKLKERDAETELITIAKPESYKRRAVAKDKNLSGFIKGQVTDPFNNPVANAYVQIQKNNNNNFFKNFTTDKAGYFKIPAVSDSIVNVAVNVSGYGTQNFTLDNNAALNQLQLQPANYASNYNYYAPTAPVNGKKQLANSYKFPNVMVYEAEPAYGWVAFGQYLEKNKVIPAGAENITGNVVVSFEVNKKGELSSYKIEQSLSKVHDEEAIRLIKQGPTWKLRSGRKARITVMVKF